MRRKRLSSLLTSICQYIFSISTDKTYSCLRNLIIIENESCCIVDPIYYMLLINNK